MQFAKNIKLSNGLKVIFEQNNNADVVSIYLGVRVGSAHETNAESGLCHLIEHMVFKGTKSFQPGEIATLVEANGGELNAYTSFDQTVYYINLPAKNFLLGLKLIKEMGFDANMDAEELEREKEVVVEEIRRGKDNPHRVLGENLFKTFFTKHNYGRPIIGTEKHVRGFSSEKVMSFYKEHYTPQNMILGICGNISEDQLSKGLEDLFRFEIGHPYTPRKISSEPERKSGKVVLKSMDMAATYFDLAFPAPAINHKDVPALDVLSYLLGEAETSLLEQEVREKTDLVHSIWCSCYTPRHPGMFSIGGQVEPKNLNKALLAIRDQIIKTQTSVFPEDKVQRALLLAKSQLVYQQQTTEGTARKWMSYETAGVSFDFDKTYMEQVMALTPHDLKMAAQKYLQWDKAVLVVLHPPKAKITLDKNLFKKSSSLTHNKPKAIKKRKGVELHQLDNGIQVVLQENHRLPLVSLKTASMGGLRYETPANNGINQLLSNVVTRSTKNLPYVNLAEQCEWMAGDISAYAGRNSFGFSLSFLSDKIDQAFDLFSDVLHNSSFDPDEIKKEKQQQLIAIRNRNDNLAQTAFRMAMGKLFAGHPYRMTQMGEKASVQKLTANSLKSYYKKIVTPKNLVISAVGDFNSNQILDILNTSFADLKGSKPAALKLKKPTMPQKIVTLFEERDKMQAHVAIGFLGSSIHSEDKHALEIISNVLSGQGGRLFLELRDKQSLAYTVTSTLVEGLETGFFGCYIGTDPRKTETAIAGILNELDKLRTNNISQEELERAKNYIIGNHEIDHQKNSAIAMNLVLNQLYGKSIDDHFDFQKQIRKVTAAQIKKTAQKYLTLDRFVISIVGPKSCKEALAKL
ncbi:MAG: insulinase family protein [Deltaproteobacteria bacterium]|nr:insulinase family protein [Deltaproteobacteria bacterium]